jgi:hypothetical protein
LALLSNLLGFMFIYFMVFENSDTKRFKFRDDVRGLEVQNQVAIQRQGFKRLPLLFVPLGSPSNGFEGVLLGEEESAIIFLESRSQNVDTERSLLTRRARR